MCLLLVLPSVPRRDRETLLYSGWTRMLSRSHGGMTYELVPINGRKNTPSYLLVMLKRLVDKNAN